MYAKCGGASIAAVGHAEQRCKGVGRQFVLEGVGTLAVEAGAAPRREAGSCHEVPVLWLRKPETAPLVREKRVQMWENSV